MARNNFIINSDYPLEKVAFLAEGDVSLTTTDVGAELYLKLTDNPTGSRLLLDGQFSKDNWQTVERIPRWADGLWSNEKEIGVRLWFGNWEGYKYRIWGFLNEDDQNANGQATANLSATKLNLTTNLNYYKIAKTGITTTTANSNTTVKHGLDYTPMFKAWTDKYGCLCQITEADTSTDSAPVVEANNSSLIFRPRDGEATTYYWRVYTHESI